MKTKKVVIGIVLGLIVALAAMPAVSQEKPADNMQLVLEKIRADKKLFVAENLQLTEAEAKAFWPVYDRYQDELFIIRARTMNLITDYANAYQNMTNAAAKKLLDENIRIEKLVPKLREAYLPKFRAVLSDIKVARYYQIENKIQAALYYELAARIPLAKAAQ